jgi:hypothetical protein
MQSVKTHNKTMLVAIDVVIYCARQCKVALNFTVSTTTRPVYLLESVWVHTYTPQELSIAQNSLSDGHKGDRGLLYPLL